MSSGVFQAHNDGACGLGSQAGCSGIKRGDQAFYLTCADGVPAPTAQLAQSKQEDGYSTGYRIRVVGTRNVERNIWDPRARRRVRTTVEENIYGWQERQGSSCRACLAAQNGAPLASGAPRRGRGGRTYTPRVACTCAWVDIQVWSQLVHADCASTLGFNVPGRNTVARPGRREIGREHAAGSIGNDAPEAATQVDEVRDWARAQLDPSEYTARDAQRDTRSALAGVATEMANVTASTTAQRSTGPDALERYPGLADMHRDERQAAIAARAQAAAQRATPKPPTVATLPPREEDPDTDYAAIERFKRLELD